MDGHFFDYIGLRLHVIKMMKESSKDPGGDASCSSGCGKINEDLLESRVGLNFRTIRKYVSSHIEWLRGLS